MEVHDELSTNIWWMGAT